MFGQTDNLLLVFGLRVLAPGYLYHAEDGKEVLGAGDEDLLIEGFGPQLGVAGQGYLQGSLVGDVHDDEVDGRAGLLDVAAVVLHRQFLDVGAEALDVAVEHLLTDGLDGFVDVVIVGFDRDLGIDDDVLIARIVEHDVGAHGASCVFVADDKTVLVGNGVLHVVVEPSLKSLRVEQFLQHELSPVACLLRVAAQGIGQSGGRAVHLFCLLAHLPQPFGKRGGGLGSLAVALLDGLLQFGKAVADGFGDVFHRLAVLSLQLVAGLVEHSDGQVLELLAHNVQLLLKLLLAQPGLGGVLLLL